MHVLFVHDHTFAICNGNCYTTGSLNQRVVDRYRKWFGNVSFLASYRNVKCSDSYVRPENIVEGVSFDLLPKRKVPMRGGAERRHIAESVAGAECLVVRMPSFMGVYAIREARRMGKPYLIEMVADPWDAYWNHGLAGKMIAPWITWQTKRSCLKAEWVLYVTNEFLQGRYPTNGNQVACSDVELDHVNEVQLRQRFRRWDSQGKTKALKLVSVGNVGSVYKGHEYVIRALPKLRESGGDYEYYLVGGGEQSRLRGIADNIGVGDLVHFVGALPHERVSSFLADMDIYLQPSLQEGLPRAVIEAMSCGLPVLGSDVGGIPELVGSSYVFRHGNVDAVVKAVSSFDLAAMRRASERNIEEAGAYLSDALVPKRDEFYGRFYQTIKDANTSHRNQYV